MGSTFRAFKMCAHKKDRLKIFHSIWAIRLLLREFLLLPTTEVKTPPITHTVQFFVQIFAIYPT